MASADEKTGAAISFCLANASALGQSADSTTARPVRRRYFGWNLIPPSNRMTSAFM
jgi:hypothetical protein